MLNQSEDREMYANGNARNGYLSFFEFHCVLLFLVKFLLLWQNPAWSVFILLIQAINKTSHAVKLTLKKQVQD